MIIPCSPTPCAGNYSMDNLPEGPRGLLFKQLLPEVQPLISVINAIAEERQKTPSQVNEGPHRSQGCSWVP